MSHREAAALSEGLYVLVPNVKVSELAEMHETAPTKACLYFLQPQTTDHQTTSACSSKEQEHFSQLYPKTQLS